MGLVSVVLVVCVVDQVCDAWSDQYGSLLVQSDNVSGHTHTYIVRELDTNIYLESITMAQVFHRVRFRPRNHAQGSGSGFSDVGLQYHSHRPPAFLLPL